MKSSHAQKLKRLLVASFVLAVLSSPSIAGDGPCIVTDPTGTPLNVRSRPNGQILGALHNDTQVVIMGSAVVGGKRWVRILPGSRQAGMGFWRLRELRLSKLSTAGLSLRRRLPTVPIGTPIISAH